MSVLNEIHEESFHLAQWVIPLQRLQTLVYFKRYAYLDVMRATLTRSKPASVSKGHTTKDMMFAGSLVVKHSLYVGFPKKATSVNISVLMGGFPAYTTVETRLRLVRLSIFAFLTESSDEGQGCAEGLDNIDRDFDELNCEQSGAVLWVTSKYAWDAERT